MNKRIDFTNLGGFPFTQFTVQEMQQSYRGALSAMSRLIGDKTILHGVEIVGSNVTDGWISVNGELIPFVGGPLNTQVFITELPGIDRTFENLAVYPSYFTKVATCALLGDFDFADLVTLLPFANLWLPGDLKQKHVDNAYVAANFDVNGYGLNKEKGWRILEFAYPAAAGKVLVNRDVADGDLNEAGKTFGAKTHTLLPTETGTIKWRTRSDDGDGDTASFRSIYALEINGATVTSTDYGNNVWSPLQTVRLNNDASAHNIMQPSYVVLTLIKL